MDEPDYLPLGAMTQEDFLYQDVRGRNALHLAFEKANPAHLVEAILQKTGAHQLLMQQEYEQWQTPLHLAANHADINLIIIIYKSISVEQFNKAASIRDIFQLTATHYLIRHQHPFFIALYQDRWHLKQHLLISLYFKQLVKHESLLQCLNGLDSVNDKAKEVVGRLKNAVEQLDQEYFYETMGHVFKLNGPIRDSIFIEIDNNNSHKTSLLIALTDALCFETRAWSDALLILFINGVIPNILYPDTQEELLVVIQRRVNYSDYELMLFKLQKDIDFYRKPLSRESDDFWKDRYQIDFGQPEINVSSLATFYQQSYQRTRDSLAKLNVQQQALYTAEHGLYVVLTMLFPCENEALYARDVLDEQTLNNSLVLALKKQHNEVAKLLMLRLTPFALYRVSAVCASDQTNSIINTTQKSEIMHFAYKRKVQYKKLSKHFKLYDVLNTLVRKTFFKYITVLNVLLNLDCATFNACMNAVNVKPLLNFFLFAIAQADSIDFILFLDRRLKLFAINAKKLAVEVPEITITLRIVEICFAERAKIFNMGSLETHRREQLSVILRDGLPNDDFEKHMNIKIISLFAGIGDDTDKILLAVRDLIDNLPFLFSDVSQTGNVLDERGEGLIKAFVEECKKIKNDVSQLDVIPQELWDSINGLYSPSEKTQSCISPEEMRAYIRIMKRYFGYHKWTDLIVAIKFNLIETIKFILAEPLLLTTGELNHAFQFSLSTHNFVAMHLLLMQSEYCRALLLKSTLSSVKPFLYKEIKATTTFIDIQLLFDVYCSTYKNAIFPTSAFSFFSMPPAIWVDLLSQLKRRSVVIAETMPSIDDEQHEVFKKIIKFERSYCEENEKMEAEYLKIYQRKKPQALSKSMLLHK